jgi:hypothetical protein
MSSTNLIITFKKNEKNKIKGIGSLHHFDNYLLVKKLYSSIFLNYLRLLLFSYIIKNVIFYLFIYFC